jgi:DNA-binding phage protein
VPDDKYRQVTAAKAHIPRTTAFQGLTSETLQQQLPVYVISLARAISRRSTMAQTMHAAGISRYELVDAVDYQQMSSVSTKDLHR